MLLLRISAGGGRTWPAEQMQVLVGFLGGEILCDPGAAAGPCSFAPLIGGGGVIKVVVSAPPLL